GRLPRRVPANQFERAGNGALRAAAGPGEDRRPIFRSAKRDVAGARPPADRDIHWFSQTETAAVAWIVCEPPGAPKRFDLAEIREPDRRRPGDRRGRTTALGRVAASRFRAGQQGAERSRAVPRRGSVALEEPEEAACAFRHAAARG